MTNNMLRPGLVSVTFRGFSPAEVIAVAVKVGLEGIEWGGDIHVPHGDLEKAREVRYLTQEAGLSVAAYGSYYRVGHSEEQGLSFQSVLDSALELDAPLVRVWAGTKSPFQSDEANHATVAADLKRIAALSAEHKIAIGLESHSGTLTETPDSTLDLLHRTAHPNVWTLWQPSYGTNESPLTVDDNVAAIQLLRPYIANLHVFNWELSADGSGVKLPLSDGEADWARYFRELDGISQERWALLEFVRDESPQALQEDAQALRCWLQEYTVA